jgi:hypothetical protein
VIGTCTTCGAQRAFFARLRGDCNGLGLVTCYCGGDTCVCHHHGYAECAGCNECEPTQVMLDADTWPAREGEEEKSATDPARQIRSARDR